MGFFFMVLVVGLEARMGFFIRGSGFMFVQNKSVFIFWGSQSIKPPIRGTPPEKKTSGAPLS